MAIHSTAAIIRALGGTERTHVVKYSSAENQAHVETMGERLHAAEVTLSALDLALTRVRAALAGPDIFADAPKSPAIDALEEELNTARAKRDDIRATIRDRAGEYGVSIKDVS